MAEAIGTTASVLGLASAVMAVTERVVNAIKNVRSAPQTIETVASILCNTGRTLQSIRQTPSLDDNNLIADQLRNIEGILVDIETLLKTLQQQQRNSKTHNILLALRDPTGKNNKLDELLGRLDTANLHLLIQMGISHVGTTEGVTTELATAHKALLEVKTTGEETNVLLKDSIALLTNQMGQSRVIPSTYRNDQGLNVPNQTRELLLEIEPRTRSGDHCSKPGPEEGDLDSHLTWRRNLTGDKAKVIAGNLCLGTIANTDTTVLRSTVTDSTFGNGLRFINGNVSMSGDQVSFAQDFWKD